ncbi:MAG: hypothetical protein JNL62_06275 [Bryobacterales bacterium]|nr:hypothetical protein [Bryobacterales bacterium]
MSLDVQSIVEAVRQLGAEQRRELTAALAALEPVHPDGPADRRQIVQAVRGKYRHIPTSSEAFLARKQEETERESQQ